MDHYQVLGLSSSVESFDCTKLSEAEIKTAYHKKALEVHPDTITRKRKRDGINSSSNIDMTAAFQQVQSSYELLMDKEARKKFDALWLVQKEEKIRRVKQREQGMRMERERQENIRKEKEQRLRMRMEREREIIRIERERQENERREKEELQKVQEEERLLQEKLFEKINEEKTRVLDEEVWMIKSKTLRVTWNKFAFGEFTSGQLRDVFEYFGDVNDVKVNKTSNEGHAIVVMASQESAIAATAARWVDNPDSPFVVRPLILC
ncbi:hypothetical protein SOVF_071100 [Spinacia oleracea]|nr:hypothetical protein SOVF_071100 [Spinacia oleracea]